MSEREERNFGEGQFSEMEGEKIDPEKLKKANRRLHEVRSGKKTDGSFEIPEEEDEKEEKKKAA